MNDSNSSNMDIDSSNILDSSSSMDIYVNSSDIEVNSSDIEVNSSYIDAAFSQTFGFPIKPEQREVIKCIERREDCILIAGCGWGKSMVYFLPAMLWDDCVMLVLSPLIALAEDQSIRLKKYKQDVCIILNGQTNISSSDMDSVIRGKFKVIFTTPEMIFKSTKLFNLLQNDSWRKKLRAVIVDEAHCVTSWADTFRPDYGRIGELRTKLPDHVSFVSMSATLPPVDLFKIKESIGYSPDVRVFNVANDRTNIKYHVVEFAFAMTSYQDLDFVLDFKKTIVYFESKNETVNARKYLISGLTTKSDAEKIQSYHAGLTQAWRSEIMEKFRTGEVRILLSTEAAGMGCDISDIERVVQYGYPTGLTALMQRIGRAVRDLILNGHGILLISKRSRPKLPHDLLRFISGAECRREVLNDAFGRAHEKVANCCDVCFPEDVPITKVAESISRRNLICQVAVHRYSNSEKEDLRNRLTDWRKEMFTTLYPGGEKSPWLSEKTFMSDTVLETLVAKCSAVIPGIPESLSTVLDWSPFYPECIDEVCELLTDFEVESKGNHHISKGFIERGSKMRSEVPGGNHESEAHSESDSEVRSSPMTNPFIVWSHMEHVSRSNFSSTSMNFNIKTVSDFQSQKRRKE